MMIALDWIKMSDEEKAFVDNLIRASIFDIVKPEEVEKFIKSLVCITHKGYLRA